MTRRPCVLVFAAGNSAEGGITGAAIGTEVAMQSLRRAADVELLELRTNGLGQLGARGLMGKLGNAAAAAWASVSALGRLALRGIAGRRIDVLYSLPAASSLGMIRNAGLVLVARLLHRRARQVYHIRNGNYFDPMHGWRGALQRYVNRHADRVLVLSKRLLPEDEGASIGVPPGAVQVLPNTIDSGVIPDPVPPRAAPPPVRVLYLSNFIAEKGYDCLMQAAEHLSARGLGARFALTFRGKWLSVADRSAFEARAAALDMQIDIGGTESDRAVVQQMFASHHIFCLPTCYAAEAQPRSILEAMANGCVVIATHYRSIPDQVIHGRTGLLIDQQDPSLLAEALEDILTQDVAAMGQAGAALFHQRFSPEAIHAQFLSALGLTDLGPEP